MPLPLASTTTPCGVARYTAFRCGQFYNWKWFSHRDKKPYFNAELTSRHGEKESEMLKNNGKVETHKTRNAPLLIVSSKHEDLS